MNYLKIDTFFLLALEEDIGIGDITTKSCIPEDDMAHGYLKAKEDGVLCGIETFAHVLELVDKRIKVTPNFTDGQRVKVGDIIAEIEGPTHGVLSGERVALNILQHMSGVATYTAKAVEKVAGTNVHIADTRKTTPCMRALEKYAVRVGGGYNHRFNLTDGILIKDNHIVSAGSITNAVECVRRNAPHTLKIEIEAETMEQIKEALDAGVDIIMLDNMSVENMRKAVEFIDGRAITEASGNMGNRDLLEVAKTGVDIISIGAITHSVKALDISLRLDN